MKVRVAEPKDYETIKSMFITLCDYLENKGQWLINQNKAERENGIAAFTMLKLFGHEESVVLVSVNGVGVVNGFLVGWMRYYPAIFTHQRVGEIQFMYPLSFDKSPYLIRAFSKWAKERGATATSNYATPGHGTSVKIFKRDGRQLSHYVFFKPFPQEASK